MKASQSQGVNRSLYSEINPLHLPEVLSLIGKRHGQGDLHVALSSTIMTLFSTVNRKECVRQQMAFYASKLEELGAELAAIEAAESELRSESSRIKRRRT